MWSSQKSIALSKLCVLLFTAALCAAAAGAPFIAGSIRTIAQAYMDGYFELFLVTCYTGAVPAAALLVSLFAMLCRIDRGCVFVQKNVRDLRVISWCCFTAAMICLVSAFYYLPWGFVGAAAGFMGLIVRVVKNVFSRAVSLQEDADFTV